MVKKLSVAAIISDPEPPAWIAELLQTLDKHAHVSLLVVHVPRGRVSDAPGSLALSMSHRLLMKYVDRPLFSQDPWAPTTLASLPFTSIGSPNDDDSAQLYEAIGQSEIVLNLTETDLPESLKRLPLSPIWSVHSETLYARIEHALVTQAPLLWVHIWQEEYNNKKSSIQRIASHALPRQSYSLSDLQRAAFWCLPAFITSRINWLALNKSIPQHEQGDAQDQDPVVQDECRLAYQDADQLATQHFWPTKTGNRSTLLNFTRLFLRYSLERIKDHIWYEQWQLAVKPKAINNPSSLEIITSTSIDSYDEIPLPDKTWWADPHLFTYKDQLYVFFEEMPYNGRRGHVSVAKLSDDGKFSEVTRVLDDEKHLSYPFVFEHDGKIFMLPETAEQRKISLYECVHFPDKWQHYKDLIVDIDSVDTTLFYANQHWWMFTNSQSHRSVNERDELRIYHSPQLEGPWAPHPLNPVITGVDRARMAGQIVKDDDKLYRVSQYGAKRYGYGVNLNRIDVLTPEDYQETPIKRILPRPGTPWLGCHSIGYLNGVTIIDRVTKRRL